MVILKGPPVRAVLLGTCVALALGGCKRAREEAGDLSHTWSPTPQAVVLGVPAEQARAAIQARLAGAPPATVKADTWKHVRKLYDAFQQNLLWLDDKGAHTPRVAAFLNALAGADSDALSLDAYPLDSLSKSLSAVQDKPTAQQLAEADILLSVSYAAFGQDLLSGQIPPASAAQSWHINPLGERLDSALALTLRTNDLAGGLARMRPQDPGYDSLRTYLGEYRQIVANGGWPAVPSGRALKRGDTDSPARLAALRTRLRAEGYPVDSGNPRVFDAGLAAAVALFQDRHDIVVDSMLGAETLQAINVTAPFRVAQIAANLERYRWLPRSLGTRYIFVNVPEFQLSAYDSGHKVLDMKVIVGKDYEDKATPVFSDSMQYVVFRPYWNVTPDIAAKEIFPLEQAHPGYLADNDMEVYDDHGRQAVRQRPGPKNALGYVKFMFPNDYNIYLHDTPNHELFNKDVRAFSHGCIRLEKPAELASWVLGWPQDRVEAAMHGQDNHEVDLPRKVPVYIVYFTAYAHDGALHFGNDLYDRDSRLVQQIASAAQTTAGTLQAQQALRTMARQ